MMPKHENGNRDADRTLASPPRVSARNRATGSGGGGLRLPSGRRRQNFLAQHHLAGPFRSGPKPAKIGQGLEQVTDILLTEAMLAYQVQVC